MFHTDQIGDWLALGNIPEDRGQGIALRTAGTGVSASPYMASWPHDVWPGALCIEGPTGVLYLPSWKARLSFHATVTAMIVQFDQAATSASSNILPFVAKDQPQVDEDAFEVAPMAEAA